MNQAAARPIGVFDSGVGGLTNLKALRDLLPNEQFIFFGDTGHLPYGDKSADTVRGYSLQVTDFLRQQGVKSIVIACNTASASAYEAIKAHVPELHVFEVISPAVETALTASRAGRIGVIATKTTTASHVYLQQILRRMPDAFVVEKATPLLVPMIEEGWAGGTITQEVIEAYMSDTGFQHIDTLILGCTHYPLIQAQIEAYFQGNVRQPVVVVNSADPTAQQVKAKLSAANLLHIGPTIGQDIFYVSDLTPGFAATARIFFGGDIELIEHRW